MSAGIADTTMLCFCLAWALRRVDFDYTPQWRRSAQGGGAYVDGVVFPRVLADQAYAYRVVVGDEDFGTLRGAPLSADGAQFVNFLDLIAYRLQKAGFTVSDAVVHLMI